MNRINPLYLGILLFIILLFSIFKLNDAKNELLEVKGSYSEITKLSSDLSGLKNIYADKNKVKRAIRRILNQSSLNSAKIEYIAKKSKIVLKSKSLNKNELNSLMSKLLNGFYDIKTLKIKRLSSKHASFFMEITW